MFNRYLGPRNPLRAMLARASSERVSPLQRRCHARPGSPLYSSPGHARPSKPFYSSPGHARPSKTLYASPGPGLSDGLDRPDRPSDVPDRREQMPTQPPAAALATLRAALVLMALLLVTTVLTTPPARADGIAELKDYLSGLNSLSADFRQITISADGGEMIESTGTFYLLRPNRFRWDYTTPNEQEIVADGSRIYVHDKDLEQVTHSSQKKILDGTPAQLLASDQPVEHYFHLRNLDEGDGRTWVELVPKTEDTEVAKLRIAFANDQLDTLLMEDRFGQLTRFIFTDLKRNPQLDYAMFRFERPAGSDFLQVD